MGPSKDASTLSGRTVVVTGASRGMGREMALRFSREGAEVALVARDTDALESVAEAAPGETLVCPGDVTDSGAVDAAVSAAVEAFGPVDVLVNNAGIGLLSLEDTTRPGADVAEETWRRILEVNLTGTFLCCRRTLPGMVDRGRGNVINVSSALGRNPKPGLAPYVASKFGVEGLTRTLALDYAAEGININGIDPGGRVDTRFFDQLSGAERRELKRPDVMNDAAVLLAAQGPDGVTGRSMSSEDWESVLG